MPKKRSQVPFSKPQTSAHPSISRHHNRRHDDSCRDHNSQKSVNDLLQHLRVSQAPPVVSTESRSDVNPQTVHPSLKHILQIPDTPPPRPRPGMRPFGVHARRRPPGPPPPRSWLADNSYAPSHIKRSQLQHNRDSKQRPNLETLPPLPDTILPEKRTLQHQALLQLAKNWDFHVQYDQYHLATLPVRYKQLLLHYIAKYSPDGIDLNGLQTLFFDDSQLSGATGTEGLTYLDLSGSIGRSLTLKDLKLFLTTKITQTHTPSSSSVVPETWDSTPSSSNDHNNIPTLTPNLPTTAIFSLTHLSLSHPPPQTSWRALLSLTPHFPTLTHLSLASWPTPSLTPNAKTAYLSTPTGNISYGTSTLYSHTLDQDFSAAAAVLRQLSRRTYCLQFLDLTGCSEWIPALAWRDGGVEWDGAWGGMRTVMVGQGWVPDVLRHSGGTLTYSWKTLMENSARLDPSRRAASIQLKRWAETEAKIGDTCWRIRSGRARAVAPSEVRGGSHEERRRARMRQREGKRRVGGEG
ncbi:MAG: hypothetical protein L6R41_003892 [Letrouitia leprolyta]|nr:MAG: hypothetical protein L6R41_003892 [Letrouitia leprolyta]